MSDLLLPRHFEYCPKCGTRAPKQRHDSAHSIECLACGFVIYFNPTSSAAALIEDEQGRLLVIVRARQPAKGKFGVPGGFADYGERLEEVLVREVKEEVNLELHDFSFFASFPNEYHFKGVIYPVTDVYFRAKVASFDPLQAEASEVAGIQFVDPREVPESQWAFSSLRAAIRTLLEQR